MNRRCLTVLMIVGVILLFSLSATAQTRTGRILGKITGVDGLPMPGVTVTASSDIVMGGSRTAVTGKTGSYRFAALPPGVYSVTAVLNGFQSPTIEAISVNIGGTAAADFVLQPEFGEEMVVTGEAPLVDISSSSVTANYSAEFLKDLPTTRNFYDIMSVSPDVSLAAEDSDRLVAGGSNVQSNNWFIDGIETTAPETGTAWIYVNPDSIQEVQVMHIGAPAEYGNMLGAALNVVTKSGSNAFAGGVNVYWFNDSLVDSNINFDSEFPEYHQEEFWDVTATLGGPIVKDRLWFFVAYEYWRDNHTFPGSDPSVNPTWYADRLDLKLSARLNDRNLLDVKVQTDDWGYPDPTSEYVTQSASAGEIGDNLAWGINYQSIFTDRTFLEVRYTGFTVNDDYLSQTGSTEAAYLDYSPPGGGPTTYWGGVYYPWSYDTTLNQASATVTHFADDWIAGDHDFKFGIQASRGTAKTMVSPSATGTYYYHYTYEYDYYGTTYPYEYYYKVDGLPYFYGNEQESVSVFADDSWTISDRLTLNLGLRYDYHKGIIPSYDRLDGSGNPTGEMIPGVDPVFTWQNWSPRIGFAYAAGADQKTVIRGSFGVYYDGNVGGNWNYPPPGHPGQSAYYGPSWEGPWDDEPSWTWDPGGFVSVDPDLKAPRTLQYSVGFERAFADNYSFGVTLLYKDTKDLIGWEIMDDGVYEEVPFTDPFTGNQYTLLDPIVNPTLRKGNRPGFTIDPNADRYWQEYKSLIFTFKRRFADFWSMDASYTYSESTGLIPRFLSQWQFNPFYGSREGSDPNSYLNANGQRLQGDRPHMLRVQANFQLPWTMNVNTLVNIQSGRPYSRQYYVPTEGRPASIMEPASNDQRHPTQYLWDIGVGKQFNLGSGMAININLQLLNVLNSAATDWFETVVLAEGDDFVPTYWVKPRRLQFHVGISF
jgi:outer membrane receptor protein involved in Fe transport